MEKYLQIILSNNYMPVSMQILESILSEKLKVQDESSKNVNSFQRSNRAVSILRENNFKSYICFLRPL